MLHCVLIEYSHSFRVSSYIAVFFFRWCHNRLCPQLVRNKNKSAKKFVLRYVSANTRKAIQSCMFSYRAVCFSPEKHQQCKTTCESSSPIKLTKYQLKRNTFTEQDEIHINKRTRLFEPASH